MHHLFSHDNKIKTLESSLLSGVSHNIVLVIDAAASQQSSNNSQGHSTEASSGECKTQSASKQTSLYGKINDKNKSIASRFWGTGEARSAGFISVRKPVFPLRFQGPEKSNTPQVSQIQEL